MLKIEVLGWVLSDKAIREIGIDGLNSEYGPFIEDDIIKYWSIHIYLQC